MVGILAESKQPRRELWTIALTPVFVVLCFAGYYHSFRLDKQQRAQMTAEAPARIVDIYAPRRTSEQDGRLGWIVYVNVTYEYTVADKQYRKTMRFNKDIGLKYKAGETAKVCYDPHVPAQSRLVLPAQTCVEL